MAHPITIRQVRKTFGEFVALQSIDLDIQAGEFLTLLGPSGSGKTTLLMSLAGFSSPDRGSIRVGDEEILVKPPHKREIGMVFQNYALFPHMSVAENVGYPLRLRKISRADRERRIGEALDLVHLGAFGDRGVDQLSGGQRQRVALARAIVFEPRILLMDEPLSALDKKLREEMQIELKHLHHRLGMTTVYVTHDQREALTMSDRVAVMNDGAIQQIAQPRDIYESPVNRFVADFIGESRFLPVGWTGDGRPTLADKPLSLRRESARPGSQASVVVRPEKLAVLDADYNAEAWNTIDGEVEETVYQGETVLISVHLGDGQRVTVRRSTAHGVLASLPETGEAIRLGLHREDTVLVAGEA